MLEEKTVYLLNQFEELAKQFAPDVIDAAVGVARVNGAASVGAGLFMLTFAFITARVSIAAFRYFNGKDGGRGDANEFGIAAAVSGGGLIVLVLLVLGLCEFLNIWNWVAIFNPKLALAKSILGI